MLNASREQSDTQQLQLQWEVEQQQLLEAQQPCQQLGSHQVESQREVLQQQLIQRLQLLKLVQFLHTFNLPVPWPLESLELPFGL
jgi:hypothetical protein